MTAIALDLGVCPQCDVPMHEVDAGLFECVACRFVRYIAESSTVMVEMRDAVARPLDEPATDALEIEALRELALLTRAAEYLTRKIRSGTIRLDRLVAVARERNSIEWDAAQLEIAITEYQADTDDRRGR